MTISPESTPEADLKQSAPIAAVEQTAPAQASAQDPEKPEDPNWKAFREARKQDRIQREAAERKAAEKEAEATAMRAAMEAAFSKQSPSPHQYERDEDEETEDERIEKKVQKAIAAREAEYEMVRQQREIQEYPQKLRRDFPDFDQYVNPETLDYLEYHHPELANPIKRQADNYQKWADAYRIVKKYVPSAGMAAQKDAQKASQNLQKPKSMSSAGVSAPGESVGSARLSEDRKQANWERMQKLLKSVG